MSKDDQKQQTTSQDESTATWQGSLEEWQDWAEENIEVWVEAMVNE
jgi:hypothetical protein